MVKITTHKKDDLSENCSVVPPNGLEGECDGVLKLTSTKTFVFKDPSAADPLVAWRKVTVAPSTFKIVDGRFPQVVGTTTEYAIEIAPTSGADHSPSDATYRADFHLWRKNNDGIIAGSDVKWTEYWKIPNSDIRLVDVQLVDKDLSEQTAS